MMEKPPQKRKIVITELAGALDTSATDVANEQMTAEAKDLQGFSGRVKRIWKHNWFKEATFQSRKGAAKDEMVANDTIFTGDRAKEKSETVKTDVVARFTSEYEGALDAEAGEARKTLGNEGEDSAFKAKVKELISRGVARKDDGSFYLTKETFNEERTQLLKEFSEVSSSVAEAQIEARIASTTEPAEKKRLQTELKRVKLEKIDKAKAYADNLWSMVQEIRNAVGHQGSLQELVGDIEVVVGRAKIGARTEAEYTKLEELIKRAQAMPVLKFVNGSTLAVAVGTAYSYMALKTKAFARSLSVAAAGFAGSALVGGALIGKQEEIRALDEQRQHMREVAQGKTFNPAEQEGRKELMEKSYETRSAQEMIGELKDSLYVVAPDGSRTMRDLHDNALYARALLAISEIETRSRLSSVHQIDLIRYSGETEIEFERLQLIETVAVAKRDIKQFFGEPGVARGELNDSEEAEALRRFPELQPALGRILNPALSFGDAVAAVGEFNEAHTAGERAGFYKTYVPENQPADRRVTVKFFANGRVSISIAKQEEEIYFRSNTSAPVSTERHDFETDLKFAKSVRAEEIVAGDKGIEQKDKLLAQMRTSKAWAAAKKAGVWGLVFGVAFQEIAAGFKDSTTGLFDMIASNKPNLVPGETEHVTALGSVARGLSKWIYGESHMMPTLGHPEQFIGTTKILMPEGAHLIDNQNGTFNLFRGGEPLAENLRLNPDGTLTDEARKALEDKGVSIQQSIENKVTQKATTVTEVVERKVAAAAREYSEKNKDFHHVHRIGWWDNDTETPDENEVKLTWGGVNGSGLDKEGKNIVYSIKGMTNDGSYRGDETLHVDDAKSRPGALKLLLSLSRDSQTHVAEVDFVDGQAKIDPESEIGKLFFRKTADGHVEFLGKYAEVAEVVDVKDGVEQVRLLATDVGPGVETAETVIKETITKPGLQEIIQKVPKIELGIPADWDIDPPPFIPIWDRYPLEPGKKPSEVPAREKTDMSPVRYAGLNSAWESSIRDSSSDVEKFNALMQTLESRRSPALQENKDANLDAYAEPERYLNGLEADYASQVEALANEAGPMSPECKLSVCIPVAGHQEGGNIYRTLESYLNQSLDPKAFELVLFVNQPDKDKEGKPIVDDATRAEIARFKAEHPELNVRVMNKVLPREQAKIGRVRKMLTDATLKRHHARGAGAGDHVFVSNDADLKGLAPTYLENFLTKFRENPKADALVGQVDWDPEMYVKNPLLHVGTRLFKYGSVQSRKKGHWIDSSGASTAVRASVYAGVGGYVEDAELGEDSLLGAAICEGRGVPPGTQKTETGRVPIGFAGARVSRLYTSTRRATDAMKKGLAPIEQWDKGFSAFDDEIRKSQETVGAEINFDNEEERKKFVKNLEAIVNRTLRRMYGPNGAHSTQLRRSLGWLGIRAEIADPRTIRITNADKLIEGLKKYRTEGLEIMRQKTAKLPETNNNPTPPVSESAPVPPEAPVIPEKKEAVPGKRVLRALTDNEKAVLNKVRSGDLGSLDEDELAGVGELLRIEKGQKAIAEVKTFDELYAVLDKTEGVQDGTKVYTPGELKNWIEIIRKGNDVVEAGGIRDAVSRLLGTRT